MTYCPGGSQTNYHHQVRHGLNDICLRTALSQVAFSAMQYANLCTGSAACLCVSQFQRQLRFFTTCTFENYNPLVLSNMMCDSAGVTLFSRMFPLPRWLRQPSTPPASHELQTPAQKAAAETVEQPRLALMHRSPACTLPCQLY